MFLYYVSLFYRNNKILLISYKFSVHSYMSHMCFYKYTTHILIAIGTALCTLIYNINDIVFTHTNVCSCLSFFSSSNQKDNRIIHASRIFSYKNKGPSVSHIRTIHHDKFYYRYIYILEGISMVSRKILS